MSLSRLLSTFAAALSLAGSGCAARQAPPSPLEDRAAITELYERFTAAASDHDWDALLALLAEDVSWKASAGALGFEHHGRPAVRTWLMGNEGKIEVLFYQAGPPRLELVSPELARVQLSMTELLLLKETGEVKQLFGVYRDEVRKRAGRWLFATRSFQLRREVTLTPPKPPEAR